MLFRCLSMLRFFFFRHIACVILAGRRHAGTVEGFTVDTPFSFHFIFAFIDTFVATPLPPECAHQ